LPCAVLTFSGDNAATVFGAISPEAGREIPRTKVTAELNGSEMVLRLQATDLSALRAAVNSYLRWIKIAEDMNKAVGE
jgi:KEOPS complex subunit Pcc1